MREFRYLVDPKRSLLLLAITGLLVWLMQSGAMPAATYLGFGLILFPFLLILVSAQGGILTALLSVLLMLLAAVKVYGTSGLWLALYLLPMSVAFLVCLEIRLPFFKTAGAVLPSLILSMIALFLIFQRKAGGDLYGALAQSAIDGLENFPARDNLLYTFWKGGLLSHGQEAGAQVFADAGSGWTFTPEVVQEFYKQIQVRISALAASLMPGMLTTYSISLSTLGLGFAVHLGSKRNACPDLGMPPFSLWHIPRPVGKKLWFLAAGYLLALLSQSLLLRMAGQMMYNVFFALYAVQGLSVLDYRFKARGMRAGLRLLLLAAIFALLPPLAMMFGLFDQAMDSRRLRLAPDSTEST